MAKRKSTKTAMRDRGNITSRLDLSFTERDSEGRLSNWCVPHDPQGSWHAGVELGYLHFSEIAELASCDETEAYHAIRCALNDLGWQSGGWGIECGFSEALARAAVAGLRALANERTNNQIAPA